MRPLLVLRPEPGNAATVRSARALGLDPIASPLSELHPLPWVLPDPDRFDALLLGSANAVRLAGAGLAALRGLPVHAVGEATAKAAREAGFTIAATGEGGLQALVPDLPEGRYLRLVGGAPVALKPPAGVTIETTTVYGTRLLGLGSVALAALRARPVVALLHSGEAARQFTRELDRLDLRRDHVRLACLALRIAEVAGNGWDAVHIADKRSDQAVLALAGQICQTV